MIYRRWSLLTSTAVISGAVVGAVVIGNLLIEPFLKQEEKKKIESTSK